MAFQEEELVNQLMNRIAQLEAQVEAKDRQLADTSAQLTKLKAASSVPSSAATSASASASASGSSTPSKRSPAVSAASASPAVSSFAPPSAPAPASASTASVSASSSSVASAAADVKASPASASSAASAAAAADSESLIDDSDYEELDDASASASSAASSAAAEKKHDAKDKDKDKDKEKKEDDAKSNNSGGGGKKKKDKNKGLTYSQKLIALIAEIQRLDGVRANINTQYHTAMSNMVADFEKDCEKTYQRFYAMQYPHEQRIAKLKKPLKRLMEGKTIEIVAGVMDDYLNDDRAHYYSRYGRYPTKTNATNNSHNSNQPPSGNFRHVRHLHGDDRPINSTYAQQQAAAAKTPDMLLGRNEHGEHNFMGWVEKVLKDRRDDKETKMNKGRRELEAEVEAQKEQRKKTEQAECALSSILPVFPNLSLEQAIKALELKGGVDRTLDWLLQQDPALLPTLLQTDADKAKEQKEALSRWDANGPIEMPSLLRNTTSAQNTLVYRVVKFRDDYDVQLKPVLDRNHIPLDTDKTHVIYIPLDKLCTLKFHIPSAAELLVLKDEIQTRTAHIIYQLFEDMSMSPISCEPDIKLSDYQIDFNNDSHTITNVSHKKDGSICYTSELSTGKNPLLHRAPIELFTQAISPTVHNVVHMHCHDMSDEITVDSVNLTNTTLELDDCAEFKQDISGRQLTYKILVRDSRVVSVLHGDTHSTASSSASHNKNGNNKQTPSKHGYRSKIAKHVELIVPAIGDLLFLPDNRLALLESVPIGLLIKTKANEDTKVSDASSSSASAASDSQEDNRRTERRFPPDPLIICDKKHPADMTGYVDVKVVMQDGKLVTPPIEVSIPLCRIKLPTDSQRAAYRNAVLAVTDSKNSALDAKLSALETELKKDDFDSTLVNDLRRSLLELQQDPELAGRCAHELKPRLDAISRAVRTAMFNRKINSTPPKSTDRRL